jgi:hypothetical protein
VWRQLPYIAKLEKAGIPTVLIDFADQTEFVRQEALANGVPEIRVLHASRTVPGPADVDALIEPLLEALTRPLTKEEEESGGLGPVPQQRVLFEGTLDEAQTFYQQAEKLPGMLDAPFAVYTDGFPIIVPTEEKVREMLTGTSRRPDELITHQSDLAEAGVAWNRVTKKGEPVLFWPMKRTATVEKVATLAVMAGCRPEYLPVVLAIAESGGGTGDGRGGVGFCVSGPVAREIGMNFGFGLFGPGNPANKTIGRVSDLMWRNLGGSVPSVTTTSIGGSPVLNGGFCFAENGHGLPAGWKGLNEELDFKKDESIVMITRPGIWGMGQQFPAGVYRSLQKSGHGALARHLGVKGVPGPHNWLEYLTSGIWATREGGITLVMVPEMAQHLCDIGFTSKEEVYEWIWKQSFEPVKDYMFRGGPDYSTNGWMSIEKTSGKPWRELPEDYPVPAGGDGPWANCIIVSGGEIAEETCYRYGGGHGFAFSIDAWR